MNTAMKDLKKRADKAWARKELWRAQLRDAYALAMPMRNLYDEQSPGAFKNDRVFDSTLQMATIRLANRIQKELVPSYMHWMMLQPGPFVPAQLRQEAERILASVTEAFFGMIAISNFDTQIHEFLLDLMIGTAAMLIHETDDPNKPIIFEAIPQSTIALEEGAFGTVGAKFRKFKKRARLIEETWNDVKFPDGWAKYMEKNADKEINFHEATVKEKDRGWVYYVFADGKFGGQRGMHTFVEREYGEEDPWIVSRWVKVSGEVQGRGPVLFALPDAKVQNRAKEFILKNASIAISGVWTAVNDGVLNPHAVRIAPGVIIPVASNSSTGARGPSLAPLEMPGRMDVSQLVIEDLTNSIKAIMMDDSLPDEEGPVRSATEIIARLRKLQSDIGSPFGRLIEEFLRPLVQKVLNIMTKKGIVNLNGGKAIRIDGATVQVTITSPLAQSQNLAEIEAVLQWLQMLISTMPDLIPLAAKVEEIPAYIAERMGVDPELVRGPEERQEMQQVVVQMLAAQQTAGINPANANQPQQIAA